MTSQSEGSMQASAAAAPPPWHIPFTLLFGKPRECAGSCKGDFDLATPVGAQIACAFLTWEVKRTHRFLPRPLGLFQMQGRAGRWAIPPTTVGACCPCNHSQHSCALAMQLCQKVTIASCSGAVSFGGPLWVREHLLLQVHVDPWPG